MCRAQLQRPVKRHAGGIVAGHRRPVKTGHRCRARGKTAPATTKTKLAQTVSNIIGTTDENGQYTGLKALLAAESVTGVKPRILGVPGTGYQRGGCCTGISLSEAARFRVYQRMGL